MGGDGDLYIYDYRARAMTAFDSTGASLWTVGPFLGVGEDEGFGNASDLQVAPNGRIWLLESEPSRLTVINNEGKVEGSFSIPFPATRIVPLRAGRGLLFVARGPLAYAVQYDPLEGLIVRDTLQVPAIARDVHFMSRELLAAASGDSAAVGVFYYGGSWLLVDPTGAVEVHDGVEEIELPEALTFTRGGATLTRVHPDAVVGAVDVVVFREVVYTLFGGREEAANRIVDTYALDDGRYLGSYELPRESLFIAVLPGGRLVTVEALPTATVRVLRWTGEGGSVSPLEEGPAWDDR